MGVKESAIAKAKAVAKVDTTESRKLSSLKFEKNKLMREMRAARKAANRKAQVDKAKLAKQAAATPPAQTRRSKPEFAKGYNFLVFIEGKQIAFSKVSSVERHVEFEPIQEGGMNCRTYSLYRPTAGEKTMTFERGVSSENITFDPGERLEQEISIYVTNEIGTRTKAYHLTGCVVKLSSLGGFDATKSELIMERLEIIYEMVSMEELV